VNTIDNYFKKITAEVESVNARFDVVAANVAEVVAVVAEVKQEFRTQFESFASEIAEVKSLLQKNEKKKVLLSEIESLKIANAALLVEMDHMRAMTVLQLENAALKCEPRSEPKQAKEPKEPKEPKKKEEEPVDENKAERVRITAMLETEAKTMNNSKGQAVIHYWQTSPKRRFLDDSPHLTDAHRERRDEFLANALDDMRKIELEDANGLSTCSERVLKLNKLNSNCNRTWNIVCGDPALHKFHKREHYVAMQAIETAAMMADINQDYTGITGCYVQLSKNYRTAPTLTNKAVEEDDEPKVKPKTEEKREAEYEKTRVKRETDRPKELTDEQWKALPKSKKIALHAAQYAEGVEMLKAQQDEHDFEVAAHAAAKLAAESVNIYDAAEWEAKTATHTGDYSSDDEPVRIRKRKPVASVESGESDDEARPTRQRKAAEPDSDDEN